MHCRERMSGIGGVGIAVKNFSQASCSSLSTAYTVNSGGGWMATIKMGYQEIDRAA